VGEPERLIPDNTRASVTDVLTQRVQALAQRRSWDLLREVYYPAYDHAVEDVRDCIGVVCHYVDTVGGPLEREERALIAKLVRQYGKAALFGYHKALGITVDEPRERYRYARQVAANVVRDMTEGSQ
jgi:hypothetical protein